MKLLLRRVSAGIWHDGIIFPVLQKHKSSAVKTVEKLEAAQKRREVILEEKKGTNRKKGIRLPDQVRMLQI